MNVQFLGATQTVTGSKYLVSTAHSKILVDCGLFQGFKELRLRNWSPVPVDLTQVDAVLITHAHLDHSGYLPLLVKNGFQGPIYATAATVDLCHILLPDSGYLQEEEARFANKRKYSKHHPAEPLYTYDDAKACLSLLRKVDFIEEIHIGHLKAQFFPAGHLLGAASLRIMGDNKSVLFSGDLGRSNDPLLNSPVVPAASDTLVIESTYGDRLHDSDDPEPQIAKVINETHQRGGTVLIPSFAVGRAQLILLYLLRLKQKKLIPDLPIFLNSPMAAQANHVFQKHAKLLQISPDELRRMWEGVSIIGTPDESKELNESKASSIIIAASGMATGGRVLHHLKSLAPNPKNSLLFVGFQAGGTRGDLITRGAQEVKIHGEFWPIRAQVYQMQNLSAHADQSELISWVKKLPELPNKIFVTHGEKTTSESFKIKLESEFPTVAVKVPEYLSRFEI